MGVCSSVYDLAQLRWIKWLTVYTVKNASLHLRSEKFPTAVGITSIVRLVCPAAVYEKGYKYVVDTRSNG